MAPDARKQQWTLWYVAATVIGVLLIQQLWTTYQQVETIPYSQFEQLVADGKVAQVTIGQDTITGALKEPSPGSDAAPAEGNHHGG